MKESKYHIVFIVLLISIFNISDLNSSTNEENVEASYLVSLIQLISNPEKYNGKMVEVAGFYMYRFSLTALFLTLDHAKYGDSTNAIWVPTNNISIEDCKMLPYFQSTFISKPAEADLKFVSIYGKFNMNNRGHLAAYQGSVENVKCFKYFGEPESERDRKQ